MMFSTKSRKLARKLAKSLLAKYKLKGDLRRRTIDRVALCLLWSADDEECLIHIDICRQMMEYE